MATIAGKIGWGFALAGSNCPWGFTMNIRDMDMLRTNIVMPQGIYRGPLAGKPQMRRMEAVFMAMSTFGQ